MISIIVAIDDNFGIGKNNSIPWHIPDDLINFKKITTNNVCIMGRNTWDSLPKKFKPLPNRKNIIVSKTYFEKPNESMHHPDVFCSFSLEHAIGISQKLFSSKQIYIIGGFRIFEECLSKNLIDKMIVTHVFGNYDADVKFPKINLDELQSKKILIRDDYTICEYYI